MTDTSVAALQSIDLPELEWLVYQELRRCLDGATIDELTDTMDLDKVTISPRLRPLVRKGLIIDSPDRRPGHSGRSQIVWRVVEDG